LVAYKAQHYQEQIPRNRFLDLPHHCDQDFFDFMLNMTIDEQKEFVPYMISYTKSAYIQKKKEKCLTLYIEKILKEARRLEAVSQ
jgi:hypothetical protein